MALGYTDTPQIPGQSYLVHDDARPQPKVVEPTNLGQIAPVTPPGDAIVLFDGTPETAANWKHVKDGSDLQWELVEGAAMQVVPKTGDIETKQSFGDIQLHVEWAAPSQVKGEGQGRGNSGVFLMGKYEIQVLDCYDNPTYPDGTTGGIYGQWPPMVNACVKPGQWNVFDILWSAPRFEAGQLTQPAYVTVIHNGVMIHHHRQLNGPTRHKTFADYEPHGDGPIKLQDHGDLVRFRNIWVRPIKGYDQD